MEACLGSYRFSGMFSKISTLLKEKKSAIDEIPSLRPRPAPPRSVGAISSGDYGELWTIPVVGLRRWTFHRLVSSFGDVLPSQYQAKLNYPGLKPVSSKAKHGRKHRIP
jgi:hypothetical protein